MATKSTGTCSCGGLKYHLVDQPLFVHACHCLACKRKSGSAFVLTTIVLERDIALTEGSTRSEPIDSIRTRHGCAECGQIIYVTATNHPATALLNTATLDDSRFLTVGAHIWVKRKHPWIELPRDVPQFDEAYSTDSVWPAQSLDRLRSAQAEPGGWR